MILHYLEVALLVTVLVGVMGTAFYLLVNIQKDNWDEEVKLDQLEQKEMDADANRNQSDSSTS